nr:MAG TPA: hypothetical protein [Caudoviricetes sp.]
MRQWQHRLKSSRLNLLKRMKPCGYPKRVKNICVFVIMAELLHKFITHLLYLT